MQYTKTPQGYLVRLSLGEEITKELISFCQKNSIHSGVFQAIGALQQAEIGFYNLEKKEYVFKKFVGDHELVSLTGNVTIVDGAPFVHMHSVLSDSTFQCIGGHLKSGIVGATCEIYLVDFQKEMMRVFDDATGLKLLQCEMQ